MGEKTYMDIYSETFGETYRKLLKATFTAGNCVETRLGEAKELLGIHLKVDNPLANILDCPARKLNYRLMLAEWLWYMEGRSDLAFLQPYTSQMDQFSDDGRVVAGAYGPTIYDQLPYVINLLRQNPNSRQAVIGLWKWLGANPEPTKVRPCSLSMQYLVREGALVTFITMRSSDTVLGLPYDFFSLSMISNYIAGRTSFRPGPIHLMIASSHVYNYFYDWAHRIANDSINTIRTPGFWPTLNYYGLLAECGNSKEMRQRLVELSQY